MALSCEFKQRTNDLDLICFLQFALESTWNFWLIKQLTGALQGALWRGGKEAAAIARRSREDEKRGRRATLVTVWVGGGADEDNGSHAFPALPIVDGWPSPWWGIAIHWHRVQMCSWGESSSQDASIIGQLVRGHNATVMDQKLAFPQVMLIATVRQRFQMISIFYFSRETQGNLLFMYKSF